MITRSLLVVVAVLVFVSPAFSQFGQSNNNRLTDLAGRLSREAEQFADDNYSSYVNGTRNLRRDIEVVMAAHQFAWASRIFYRITVHRRQLPGLRDALDMLRTLGNPSGRYNLQRSNWSSLQR